MIGHNGGPSLVKGDSWARHCWSQARAELLPNLPLEIIRIRVARAKAIGLEYKTYATIRATTGRDIIAFLYSSESLQIRPVSLAVPPMRAAQVAEQAVDKLLLTAPDMTPDQAVLRLAAQGIDLAFASPAPAALGSWTKAREAMRAALAPLKLPGDAVLMVGEGSLQKAWAEAGKLAGFLPGERFFRSA